MAEEERSYYGYKPQPAFNWFEASEQQLGKVQKVIKSRVDERAKNEEYLTSVNQALQKVESGNNQNYQEVLTNGGFSAKEQVYDMSQLLYSNQISSKDFRKYTTNVEQSWNNMAEISKNFNSTNAIFADAQAAGTASGLMDFNAQEFARTSDWKKSQMIWDKNGNGYLAQTDDTGNVIDGSAKSLFSINNLAAQMHTKVDLAARINENAKLIGDWRTEVSGMTSDGFNAWIELDKSGYQTYLADLQGTLLSDPNNAASVLSDNGANSSDYFYYSADQQQALIDEGKDMEFGILVSKDQDGNNVARLTTTQREKAEKQIASELKAQIGIKETPPKERKREKWERDEYNQQQLDKENYSLANAIISGDEEVENLNSKGVVKNAWWDGQDIMVENNKGEIIRVEHNADGGVMAQEIGSFLEGGKTSYRRGEKLSAKTDYTPAVGEYKVPDVSAHLGKDGKAKTIESNSVFVGGDESKGAIYSFLSGTGPIEQMENIIDKVKNDSFGWQEHLRLSKEKPKKEKDTTKSAYLDTRTLIHQNIVDNMGKYALDLDKDIIIEGYGKDAKVKIRMKDKDGKVMVYTYPLNKPFLQQIQKKYTNNLEEVQKKERNKKRPSFKEWTDAGGVGGFTAYIKEYPK